MARPYDAAKAADDARQAMTKGEHQLHARAQRGRRRPAGRALPRAEQDGDGWQRSRRSGSRAASGLPLRQTVAMLEQGAVKLKHEVRSDYTNVRAPAGVSR